MEYLSHQGRIIAIFKISGLNCLRNDIFVQDYKAEAETSPSDRVIILVILHGRGKTFNS